MVITTLRIMTPPEKRDEILKTFRSIVGPTRIKPGCISSRIFVDLEDANALSMVEEWETEADLNRHVSSREYTKLLALLDMSSEPPEISFKKVLSSSGLDAVKAARKETMQKRVVGFSERR
jgi:quinol monooxygenase YgiN